MTITSEGKNSMAFWSKLKQTNKQTPQTLFGEWWSIPEHLCCVLWSPKALGVLFGGKGTLEIFSFSFSSPPSPPSHWRLS